MIEINLIEALEIFAQIDENILSPKEREAYHLICGFLSESLAAFMDENGIYGDDGDWTYTEKEITDEATLEEGNEEWLL